MDFLLLLPVALVVLWVARARHQQRRIAILARYLSGHNIEANIETLSQGYMRALDESDAARSGQAWAALRVTEDALCQQVRQLAEDFAGVEPTATRVSKFPIWLPRSPAFDKSFDMREALRLHARGISRAVEEQGAAPKDRASRSGDTAETRPRAAGITRGLGIAGISPCFTRNSITCGPLAVTSGSRRRHPSTNAPTSSTAMPAPSCPRGNSVTA